MSDEVPRKRRDLTGLSNSGPTRTVAGPPPPPTAPIVDPVAIPPVEQPLTGTPSVDQKQEGERRRASRTRRRAVDERVTLSLRHDHPALIQRLADEQGLYCTEAVETLITRWAPSLEEAGHLGPAERRRPKQRADRVIYSTAVRGGTRTTLDHLASLIADGDRSRVMRAIIDCEIGTRERENTESADNVA